MIRRKNAQSSQDSISFAPFRAFLRLVIPLCTLRPPE